VRAPSAKKIPGRIKYTIRDIPVLPTDEIMRKNDAVHAVISLNAQAGLLTFGSSYRPHLPSLSASGILQLSSPITAAGPSPILTGFPLKLIYEHLIKNGRIE
jgi:hypothetical protein